VQAIQNQPTTQDPQARIASLERELRDIRLTAKLCLSLWVLVGTGPSISGVGFVGAGLWHRRYVSELLPGLALLSALPCLSLQAGLYGIRLRAAYQLRKNELMRIKGELRR
jgi:hypothetical protein